MVYSMSITSDCTEELCPLLKTVITKGNITTYEWKTGQAPTSVIETLSNTQLDAADDKVEEESEEVRSLLILIIAKKTSLMAACC